MVGTFADIHHALKLEVKSRIKFSIVGSRKFKAVESSHFKSSFLSLITLRCVPLRVSSSIH